MLVIYVIGPAGSGKTTLIKAFLDYMQEYNNEVSLITVNLDPGVRSVPYSPDIDIQDYITVDEVIDKTGLGPNGAMIAATDQMVNYIEDLKYEINQYNDPDIVLIDTPGQLELFAFRNSGPMIANALGFGSVQRAIMFCYDAHICSRPNGLVSTLLLATSVQYRFPDLPLINVLTKKDLIPEEKLEMTLSWLEDEMALEQAVEKYERGMLKELTLNLGRTFQDFGAIKELTPISAKHNDGIDNLWGLIQQVLNDDTSPFY